MKPATILRVLKSDNGPVWRDIQIRGNRVLRQAKALAPRDRGTLYRSITLEMRSTDKGPTAVVGTNVPYAIYVHEGTGVHGPRRTPIRPVNKRFLAWLPKRQVVRTYLDKSGKQRKVYAKRALVFAKQSRGSRPVPFLRDALKAAK